MFTIPNEDDATYEAQARVSSVDLQALATGFSRTGVVSGMAVSVSTGRDFDISSGAYEINGSPISSVAKTGTIGAGDATHPRIDIVSVDGDGSVRIAAGTPAADPVAPNVVLDRVVLASIYVPAGMATLLPDMISDRRVLLTSAGLNAESIQDIVAAFTAAGTGINITYDDVLGTLTFSVNALSITDTFPVNSQAAMLALTAQRGDVAVRSDLPGTFILATDDPTQLANWVLLPTPTDSVLSVNGATGAVTITLAGLEGVPTSRTVAGLALSSNITATNLLAALSAQSGADFALNGHKLTGVANGTSAQDAVTKAQLDTKGDLVATHGFRLVGNSVRDYCIPGEAIVTGTSTVAPSANRCQFERWRLRSAQTFDRVAMEVFAPGGAGKLIRMSVWSVDGYGQPAALIADFGTIDANSATFQALTISLTLPAGDYIGVWVSDGTPTVRTVQTQLLGSNALAGVGSTTPIRNQATFSGSGIAAGGFPSTPGSGVGAVSIERDIYTFSAATASAMRLREAA